MARSDAKIVIVGAGAAGLAAAARLAQAGRRVVVLEARDRIGGRIWSAREAGWSRPVEFGAEFVHTGNPALAAWLRKGKLKQEPLRDGHWLVERGRRLALPDAWERTDSALRRIGPGFRGSFGRWLATHAAGFSAADRVLVGTFVEGFHGAPLDRMSAQTLYRASQEEESQSRLKGGYGALLEVLRRALPPEQVSLHGRAEVETIRWRRGAVEVATAKRGWRASAVLITVPLGVLRARAGERGAIRFLPNLTGRRDRWRHLGQGHAIRVVLRLRADLWRRGFVPAELRARDGRAFGFLHSDEPEFPVWWTRAPEPVLVGWTGGIAAGRMAGWAPRQIYRAARGSLARGLGCTEAVIARAVLDWRTHDWAGDPFTRGAYSFSVAGHEDAPQHAAEPVAGTLFFAGEATADALELGTVHGALASGERAAAELLARSEG